MNQHHDAHQERAVTVMKKKTEAEETPTHIQLAEALKAVTVLAAKLGVTVPVQSSTIGPQAERPRDRAPLRMKRKVERKRATPKANLDWDKVTKKCPCCLQSGIVASSFGIRHSRGKEYPHAYCTKCRSNGCRVEYECRTLQREGHSRPL